MDTEINPSNEEQQEFTSEELKPEHESTYKKIVAWSQKPQSRLLLAACATFGFIFTCFIFVFQIVLTPIIVVGASMQPTINVSAAGSGYDVNCDIVYYYPEETYSRNDIVIIDGNYAHGVTKIIKRIIATPNQTIKFEVDSEKPSAYTQIKKYFVVSVFVNDNKLDEPYIKETMEIKLYKDYSQKNYEQSYYAFYDDFTKKLDADGMVEYTLGSDEYFCMGDNRNNSTDSRYFGMVKASDIEGRVVLHVKHGESLFIVIWKRIFG